MANINIERYKNDTYSISDVITVDGDYVDITDYAVYLYYLEIDKLIRLQAIKSDAKNGKVVFYPKINYSLNITDTQNPTPYTPFAVAGKYDYSIVKVKITYDTYALGDYVFVSGEYVPYDLTVHNGMVRYTRFEDKRTHTVGKIIINDRVGE